MLIAYTIIIYKAYISHTPAFVTGPMMQQYTKDTFSFNVYIFFFCIKVYIGLVFYCRNIMHNHRIDTMQILPTVRRTPNVKWIYWLCLYSRMQSDI